MKKEYDFSNAERGKFYRRGAQIRLPIYLEAALQLRIERIAKEEGKEIGEFVNEVLAEEAARHDSP